MIRDYPQPSVTDSSDRSIAIEGLTNILRAVYANQLRDTVYILAYG